MDKKWIPFAQLSADELCDKYRDELERLYGKDIADASIVENAKGWFYIALAREWTDGTVKTKQDPEIHRRDQIIMMISNLRQRKPEIRSG